MAEIQPVHRRDEQHPRPVRNAVGRHQQHFAIGDGRRRIDEREGRRRVGALAGKAVVLLPLGTGKPLQVVRGRGLGALLQRNANAVVRVLRAGDVPRGSRGRRHPPDVQRRGRRVRTANKRAAHLVP